MTITKNQKIGMFDEMLRLEKLAEAKTYDGRDYFEQMEGAYMMLKLLGLHKEYIEWAQGK